MTADVTPGATPGVQENSPDVSQEAKEIFRDSLPQAVIFADLLRTTGLEWGLLGPREVPRLWDRHLVNSAIAAPLLPTGASLLDVGSGAGLPGIPLAIARPDLTVTLLDGQLRRVRFLELAVETLGLAARVTVVRGRVEEHRETYDAVTARAVAPLARLVPWVAPTVSREGGRLVAICGADAHEQLAAAGRCFPAAGLRRPRIVVCGEGAVAQPTTVVVAERA